MPEKLNENSKIIFNANGVRFVAQTGYDQNWGEQFEELGKYKQEHGNCNVPSRYSEDRVLGNWVTNQRSAINFKRRIEEGEELGKGQIKKANAMTPHRMKALEGLGFVNPNIV